MRRPPHLLRAMWQWLTARRTRVGGGRDQVGAQNTREHFPLDEVLHPQDQIVEHLIMDRDGRIKQGEIVALTDWSPAKVSRLLSEMEADGRIVRIEVGREKVVCFPTTVPAAYRDFPENVVGNTE